MKNATIELDEKQEEIPEVLSPHQQEAMEAELQELATFEPLVKLMSLASEGKDHPVERDVLNWKKKYGKVYVSNIVDETDVYVWRPILRQEWRNLNSKGYGDALDKAQALVEQCLLFPRINDVLYKKPAGTLLALETKIMFQSGFVSEQMLLSSIREIS